MKKLVTLVALAALPLSAEAFNGVYTGATLGLTHRQIKIVDTSSKAHEKVSGNFGTFGMQIGYAKTLENKLYLGSELDFGFSTGTAKKMHTLTAAGNTYSLQFKGQNRYKGNISGRVGYNFGSFVAYTGLFVGLENNKITVTEKLNNSLVAKASKKYSSTAFGPILGFEYAINDSFTTGIEARYAKLKDKKIGETDTKLKTKGYDLMLRLNYAF